MANVAVGMLCSLNNAQPKLGFMKHIMKSSNVHLGGISRSPFGDCLQDPLVVIALMVVGGGREVIKI